MNQQIVAQVSKLSHRYRNAIALDQIDLKIPAGEMVGLIGPDGVGKSSLLSLIAGVRKIQEGTIDVLDGRMNSKSHRRSICPRIAYMPQGLGQNLYMSLSVFENIDFFGRLFGQSRQERTWRIKELLNSTGLEPFANRAAAKLSGGMKQKLGLCCALIHDPDLLILDEPTTGVDPLSRLQFWKLIERIRVRRTNMSVIVATAYMDEARQFDWLIAMDEGRILATGSPEELLTRTGCSGLEEAFIALLPKEKRVGHRTLSIPPRLDHDRKVAIEARDLTRYFGHFTAVDHVSFRIERGEIFGFLGSNGCGKTTTMKMLTGLLPISEGEALLFDHPIDARDIETRKRVGYMTQSFSLYTELTVRQNLELHARIFHIPNARIPERVVEMTQRFGLDNVIDELAERLPLGIRQRLSLAVAVIHKPEILILDEPTSGVDPVARDQFWGFLVQLSRDDKVTIFISTHFMNEAERCDRISLMHAGKVLAQDAPASLVGNRACKSLEDAFISYLTDSETDEIMADSLENIPSTVPATSGQHHPQQQRSGLTRIWAYARREALEILRDPIRMAFALLGPIVLMLAFGYGITFDIEGISYAVLDHDQTTDSRLYLENFSGSRYFEKRPPLRHSNELKNRLQKGQFTFAIEIPPGFGRNLKRNRQPEVGIWIDGTMPYRAETALGYIMGVHQSYLEEQSRILGLTKAEPVLPAAVETRFLYNQDFKSVYAIVPGTIMLLLVWIPSMMTAAGVVREKEMGSITNFYATPVTGLEFLLGKQFPYIIIALLNFMSLVILAVFLFDVPVKGSMFTLILGTVLYVSATTGLGLLMSSFMKTQIAAIFGTAIITVTPAVNFSGFFTPVATLTGGAQIFSQIFPSSYFQQICLGTFTKSMGFESLIYMLSMLLMLSLIYLALGMTLLRTQER